jgi:hypothetical protein
MAAWGSLAKRLLPNRLGNLSDDFVRGINA